MFLQSQLQKTKKVTFYFLQKIYFFEISTTFSQFVDQKLHKSFRKVDCLVPILGAKMTWTLGKNRFPVPILAAKVAEKPRIEIGIWMFPQTFRPFLQQGLVF